MEQGASPLNGGTRKGLGIQCPRWLWSTYGPHLQVTDAQSSVRHVGRNSVAQKLTMGGSERLCKNTGYRPLYCCVEAWGSRGFHFCWGGGGGVDRAPQYWGGGRVGKRAQLTEPLISYYEFWCQRRQKFFSALKMVNFFSHQIQMANDDFSETPRCADSKNPIFIFCQILVPGHLRGPGVSHGRIFRGLSTEPLFGGGGALARGLYRTLRPEVESPPTPV